VYFTRSVFAAANPLLADLVRSAVPESANTLVYLDNGLIEAQPQLPRDIAAYFDHQLPQAPAPRIAVLPGGEQIKDGWPNAMRVLDEALSFRLCRHSPVIAVGGGAFLDAVGLGAALAHRGVRLIRLPTSTLSQCDSGVGVKVGINQGKLKNAIGVFAPPFAVINDLNLLRTLPQDVLLDGIAEAFKVAIIRDRDFFTFLAANASKFPQRCWEEIETAVRRSALLHMDHIRLSGDPFELGSVRPLDFGHWSAHWLEGASGFSVRHGQAVSIGLGLDSAYARNLALISNAELDSILTVLSQSGLPLWHPLLESLDGCHELRLLDGLRQFREHLGGDLHITLPAGIGGKVEVTEMDPARIVDAVRTLKRFGGRSCG